MIEEAEKGMAAKERGNDRRRGRRYGRGRGRKMEEFPKTEYLKNITFKEKSPKKTKYKKLQ